MIQQLTNDETMVVSAGSFIGIGAMIVGGVAIIGGAIEHWGVEMIAKTGKELAKKVVGEIPGIVIKSFIK